MTAADFDTFAATLLEEAKRFVERAVDAKGGGGEAPNLHAALMLAFCALEAHVNAVCDEMTQRDHISIHVKGILLERDVRLVDGHFELENRLKISRLEDRLDVLHEQLGIKANLHGAWRRELAGASALRNKLTHPKGVPNITAEAVKQAVLAVISAIDSVYQAVYDRPFPAADRELASKLDF